MREAHRKQMRRVERANDARYLTFSCSRRLALFSNDAIKDVFVEELSRSRERLGFGLLAYVVMPEHVHLLVWPRLPEAPVSKVVWDVKRAVARRVIGRWREIDAPVLERLQHHRGVRFWQRGGGYDRNVFTRDELEEKVGYIHANPVRRGLAVRPTDWAWSSARWYAGEREGELGMDEVRRPGV